MTGTLELTARLCCSRLLASCAEMARCAGRSLKALARVGACSSLMSRGVDAALRNATCRVQGRETVKCMSCKPYVLDAHVMRCAGVQAQLLLAAAVKQQQPTHLHCDPALGGTLQVQDAVALSLAADGSGAPDCATAG